VAEVPSVHNELGGTVHGVVVQIGSVHGAVVAVERPRQLPLAIGQFTGRDSYLAALDALISSDTVVISAVDGTAGIGKTMTVVTWAHRVQHRFPDGTLFADLRGYGPGAPATAEEVLDGFLHALGLVPDRIPVGVQAKAARFRSLLSGRRVLIVLDNAGSAEQVRPLLPGEPGSMVVTTSRDNLNGLVVTDAAHRLSINLPTEREAVELVARIVGPTRAGQEREAVGTLVRLCARLPLALRIAATRVTASPYNSVAGVVAELRDERARLDVLSSDGDERTAVRAVLGGSYRRLPDDQAVLFRRLGSHAGPEFSVEAAAAVAGIDLPQARRLVDALAAAHLTDRVARDRYRCHDLLHAYAAELAERCDGSEVRRQAVAGLANWYARIARECDRVVFPGNFRIPFGLRHSGPDLVIDGRAEALKWLDTERSNLVAVLRQAVEQELHAQVVHVAESLRYLFMRGAWKEIVELACLATHAARSCCDRVAECWTHIRIGEIQSGCRNWAEARAELDLALRISAELDSPALKGIVLGDLAALCNQQEYFDAALTLCTEALPLVREIDSGRTEAVTHGQIAVALNGLGRHEEAMRHSRVSLALRRQAQDVLGEALARHQMAVAWHGLGDDEQAIAVCRDVIAHGRALSSLEDTVAGPLCTLAMSLRRLGKDDEALACWREAAELFDDYGRPWLADQARSCFQR
jgi:tetratricopeptide (TPR) repeat protein